MAIPVPVHFDGHNINIITEDSPSSCKQRTNSMQFGGGGNGASPNKKSNVEKGTITVIKNKITSNNNNNNNNAIDQNNNNKVKKIIVENNSKAIGGNDGQVNLYKKIASKTMNSTTTKTQIQTTSTNLNKNDIIEPIKKNDTQIGDEKADDQQKQSNNNNNNNTDTNNVIICNNNNNNDDSDLKMQNNNNNNIAQKTPPPTTTTSIAQTGNNNNNNANAEQETETKDEAEQVVTGEDNELKMGDPLQPQLTGKDRQNLYKTELCREWSTSGWCYYNKRCSFAHGLQELRPVFRSKKWRTKRCRNWHTTGYCPYEHRCQFLHDQSPPRRIQDYATANARALVAAQQRMQPLYFHYQVEDPSRDEDGKNDGESSDDSDNNNKNASKYNNNNNRQQMNEKVHNNNNNNRAKQAYLSSKKNQNNHRNNQNNNQNNLYRNNQNNNNNNVRRNNNNQNNINNKSENVNKSEVNTMYTPPNGNNGNGNGGGSYKMKLKKVKKRKKVRADAVIKPFHPFGTAPNNNNNNNNVHGQQQHILDQAHDASLGLYTAHDISAAAQAVSVSAALADAVSKLQQVTQQQDPNGIDLNNMNISMNNLINNKSETKENPSPMPIPLNFNSLNNSLLSSIPNFVHNNQNNANNALHARLIGGSHGHAAHAHASNVPIDPSIFLTLTPSPPISPMMNATDTQTNGSITPPPPHLGIDDGIMANNEKMNNKNINNKKSVNIQKKNVSVNVGGGINNNRVKKPGICANILESLLPQSPAINSGAGAQSAPQAAASSLLRSAPQALLSGLSGLTLNSLQQHQLNNAVNNAGFTFTPLNANPPPLQVQSSINSVVVGAAQAAFDNTTKAVVPLSVPTTAAYQPTIHDYHAQHHAAAAAYAQHHIPQHALPQSYHQSYSTLPPPTNPHQTAYPSQYPPPPTYANYGYSEFNGYYAPAAPPQRWQ